MDKKIKTIYRVANKCGFAVKHRECTQDIVFALKDIDSDLRTYFEIFAKNEEDANTFCENVAHAVFLFLEDFDPHTETKKYLEKMGGNLTQYTEVYTQINNFAWKLRSFWLSV